jgi:hypothetical protein
MKEEIMRKILLIMIIALALAAAACKDKDKAMTWAAVEDSPFGYCYSRAVAYGGGRFVAGSDEGAMAYSDDGANWTGVTYSAAWDYTDTSRGDTYTNTAHISAIAYGNNRFVAVGGYGKIAYSTDNGITWTAAADSPFPATYANGDWALPYAIYAIAYGGGKWVAGGLEGKMAYSADNGATWTAVTDSAFGESDINAIAYGNKRFVAGGVEGKMAYSDDGINWTAVADSTFGSDDFLPPDINAIAYGNNRWVAVGEFGAMAYSDDGATWTAVADSAIWEYEYTGSFSMDLSGNTNMLMIGANILAIAYGNKRFVAVAEEGKTAYSDDGVTWTAVADSAFGDNAIYAIAYGNGKFVAVGAGGAMAYADWK